MVQTHGLTHINLAVRDLGRALRFYEPVFGLREYGRGDGLVHTQASGRHDIISFAEDPTTAGLSGGIAHFGFASWTPATSTVPSPRSNTPEAACSVAESSLPASPMLTSPIRMATKLRSGSSELPVPPEQPMIRLSVFTLTSDFCPRISGFMLALASAPAREHFQSSSSCFR
jgi:Glyoxalase/Bleomycin resistance protein/Dioxygenase superfamily